MKLLTHYLNSQTQNQHFVNNWRENSINDLLLYSFRSTDYNRSTFPSTIHYHDYYELVVFIEGDIRYLCESEVYTPQYGDIILIPPGNLHMSMLNEEQTKYTRHVFYLYPTAFDELGCGVLTSFVKKHSEGLMLTSMLHRTRQEMISLLTKLDKALSDPKDESKKALGIGLIIQIFYLMNQEQFVANENPSTLPSNVIQIQRYLDENYTQITSVSEIAAHFFYSREYLSRLFKQYFHTTVADYLTKRRIACSQRLITQGSTLIDAAYQSGFSNVNTFIRAFRNITGLTPSAYRKALQDQ